MKKCIAMLLTIVLMVSLCGCLGDGSIRLPDKMSDGTAWDPSWTPLGNRIGVEQPGGDFLLLTSNGKLDGADIYYATWIGGEETKVDKDTYVYDAQIYLMAEPCTLATDAEDTLQLWREQIGDEFAITEEKQITAAGVDFTLIFYDCLAEDSHYAQGVMALGLRDATAIIADLAKVADYELELGSFMEQFLGGFHYA